MTAGNKMSFLWMMSIAWILEIGDVATQALKEAPAHTLKKCTQDKLTNIQCEEFIEDLTEMVSLWPPGPYAIPMTRYGCPESSMQGWREGILRLAWQEPQKVQIRSNSSTIDIIDEDMIDNYKTERMFSDFERYQLYVPTTPNSMTLHFCYKHRSNATLDIGLWPDGNYRLFGTERSCPDGFEDHLSDIKLPQISWWDSDGYLPYFEVLNNNTTEDTLQLRLCSRNKTQVFSDTSGNRRNWTHFFLIKGENTSCPLLVNAFITEETLYVGLQRNETISMVQVMATLCFYELKRDEEHWLYETRRKNAYSVLIASTTEGNKTFSSESVSFVWGFFFKKTVVQTVWRWTIVDLGRTIPVSSVDIAKHVREEEQDRCFSHDISCFISRGKLDFLHSKALSCLFVPYCRVKGLSISLVFKRIKDGRYLALMYKEESSIGEVSSGQAVIYKVNVFTEKIKYDMSDSCNSDLGMLNLNIGDDQLTASSWQQEFTPSQSRPYLSGWCPQFDDQTPYLKVSFSTTRIIDGLSVYIARDILLINELNTVVSFGGPSITLVYDDNGIGTTSSKILRTDLSKLDAGTQSFWFLKPIQTNMVQMYIDKEQEVDLACLRFEFHGCIPKEELLPSSFFKRERQIAHFDIVGYISEIDAFNSVLTSIGFPENYQSGQFYKWIVRYSEAHFVKLVFTHLDLNTVKDGNGLKCHDSIILSEDLVEISPAKTKEINSRYEITHSLSAETKVTFVVLTFVTCSILSPVHRGSGFRAIATYQDIPACFSINSLGNYEELMTVSCHHPSMLITSASYLGFQFINTREDWFISVPTKRISLRFIHFNIPCKNIYVTSTLTITDIENELSYCNINRPPDMLNSSSDELTITYYKYFNLIELSAVSNIIGFRMFYTVIEEPERELIDYMDSYSKILNVAIFRDAHYPHYVFDKIYNLAEKLTDGNTFPDPDDSATSMWWLLDLKGLYDLEYSVFYSAVRTSLKKTLENCDLAISTGLDIYEMQQTGFLCSAIGQRRVLYQTGIKTRYIRLNPANCDAITLCEVEVYGRPDVEEIHGEWGDWTAWTDVCFCDKKQYRHRLCNDPKPDYGGQDCPGGAISDRHCQPDPISCKVYRYSGTPDITQEHCMKNSAGSVSQWGSWFDWSPCSSDCGKGLMTRQRLCTLSENQENKTNCIGQDREDKNCFGNERCLVCSDTFSKCYTIVPKYINWQQAQLECFSRNMTLVTMMSLSEMRFVKYLLREKRGHDRLPINYFNADFYVHIGLTKDLKYNIAVWENGQYALYFKAWKTNHSSSGICVRMNFRLFNDDNTWEFEDCEKQMSEYTMCQYQRKSGPVPTVKSLKIWKDEENVEVPEQIPASEYEGEMNVTVSGQYCNGTYCRETDNVGYVWCLNPGGVYEECSVKLPAVKNSSLTFHKYLGTLDKTFSGKTCQRWDKETPHRHSMHGNLFKGEGISDAANYCRDIGETDFLWCFTNEVDTRWEPCLLGDLKTERKCITRLQYTGTWNTTITGKICIQWDRHVTTFRKSLIPEINLTQAENYCRDPLNFGFLWCFIDYSSEDWEPCQPEDHELRKLVSDKRVLRPSFDMFMCGNEIQIPKFLRCNGRFDCEDKSDETDCLDVYTVHPMSRVDSRTIDVFGFEKGSFFRCITGELISAIARCNVVIDCLDASDEINCNYNGSGVQECGKEQFQCDDGDCIHISQVCDYIDDCIDGSDEYCDTDELLSLSEYRCKNGQFIPLTQRCDAIKQCPDGSDEIECETCQSDAFHCDFARCIPKRLKCDNFMHCQDGTDETSCEAGDFNTCQDAWNAGFRQTGYYLIGSLPALCVFDDVLEEHSVTTVLHFDVRFMEIRVFNAITYIKGFLYNEPLTLTENSRDFMIFNQVNSNCTQQVEERCSPTYEILDHFANHSNCSCGVVNFKMERPYTESVAVCQSTSYDNLTLSRDKPLLETSNLYYDHGLNSRMITLSNHFEPYMEIIPGPATCRHDFVPLDNDFPCNVNGKHIPFNQRCIYDIDASGFPTGCTDGSHLINCDFYNCPPNTLKCPGSYCIAQRFLCDGIQQCPEGEDEDGCGCSMSNNEILIIYDSASTKGPDFSRFARQFYTQSNIVRLLGFRASKPLQIFNIKDILLDVYDIEINKSPATEKTFSCNYKVFAKDFLSSVHFTNLGIKGVIIIQNSEISKDVFMEIAENGAIHEHIKLFRVSQYLDSVLSFEDGMNVSNFTDVRVRRWSNLDDIGAEYFSELCEFSTKVHCPSGYKCSSSRTCIPMEQVCDGHKQCLHGDDEVLCDFKCPASCKCDGYFVNCRDTNFEPSMLYTVPKNTRHLDFSFNRKLNSVLEDTLLNFTKLAVLNVSSCGIKVLSQYAFLRLRNLRNLDLSFNNITVLPDYVFVSLIHLKRLILRGNKELAVIERHAFSGLSHIRDLNLAKARIYKILAGTFEGLNLKNIDLSNNKIEEIQPYAFRDSFIENINFERNDIRNFHKDIFTGLIGLEILKTPAFKFCCIRPNYVSDQNCYPQKDEFSSCDDLMRHSGLQFMIWLIGIMAFIGNALSVFYRIKHDRERLKLGYGIFVTNLAVADFLMAVYLLIIAIADSAFRKRYIYVDDYWRHSVWCNIAGVLSTTSSEASVLFLCLITLDRLLVIKFPFGGVKITTKIAVISVSFAWVFSAFVALLPLAYVEYFNNEFYSKSGVCIALPLTMDRPSGWVYSLALFVCLNFVTFILIAFGQLSIFLEVQKSSGIAKSAATSRKRDLKVARNLLLVVATDFLCWFPIGVMGMLALSGHPVSGEVYAWAAVFILPVNSALNPLLYTLSAIIGGKSFNPSTDEQSFRQLTKDIGENAMKCIMAGHNIFPKKTVSQFHSISTVVSSKFGIPMDTVVIIATKLALSLDALHCSSLVMQPLDGKSVSLGVHRNQITGVVKIKSHPCISNKPEDRQKDMFQYGMILKSLIAATKNKRE